MRILSLILVLWSSLGIATETVSLNSNSPPVNVTPYLEMLEDPSDSLSLNEAIKAFKSEKSLPVTLMEKQFLAPQQGWYRLRLVSKKNKNVAWLLDGGSARIGHVYLVEQNKPIQKIRKNFGLGKSDSFNLYFSEKQPAYIYFKYQCYFKNQLKLMRMDTKINAFNNFSFFILPTYCGIIFSIFLINLYLYLTTHYTRYLKYCGYIFSIIATHLIEYSQADTLFDLTLLIRASLLTTLIFALLFMMDVLNTKHNAPRIHLFANLTLFAYIPILFSVFYLPADKNLLPQFIGLFSHLLLAAGGIIAWIKGVSIAKWYCISWGCFIAFCSIAVLLGEPLYYYPGVTLECTLLSLMLANLINQKRQELVNEHKYCQQALNNLSLLKNDLELRIKTRTNELEKSNALLSSSIKELKSTQAELIEIQKMVEIGKLLEKVASTASKPVKESFAAITRTYLALLNLEKNFLKRSLTRNALIETISSISQELPTLIKSLNKTSGIIQTFKQIAVQEGIDEVSTFSLTVYLENLLNSFYEMDNKIHFNLVSEEPFEVKTYQAAIYQVITRIVENSRQHAFANTIDPKIDIIITKIQNKLRITVKDNGKGIPESELNSIFDAFYTIDKTLPNTGLGLHIVRNLVTHRLNGNITCESCEGKGLSIVLNLPLEVNREMVV